MKKTAAFILAVIFAVLTVSASNAAGSLPLVLDYADLLTSAEEAALDAKLREMSERLRFDIVALSADDLGGKATRDYAADIFDDYEGGGADRYGYGADYDGILMLIDMENHEVYILGTGSGKYYADDNQREYILDSIWDSITSASYADAYSEFADTVEYLITEYEAQPYEPYPGKTDGYDYGDGYSDGGTSSSDELVKRVAIAVIAGFVISLIVVLSMRSKMKTVRPDHRANNYMIDGSFVLTESSDNYLYSTVTKTAKPKNDNSSSSGGGGSSFSSSSGTSHTGGGRSF